MIDKSEMIIEFCNKCHPAYTGKRKIAAQGAIEKLKKRYGNSALTGTEIKKSK